MSDGQRTWEIQIPGERGTPAFEVVIPLEPGADPPSPLATEADEEIIVAKRAKGETVVEDEAQGAAPSYLKTLDRVRQLYQKKQFELAFVQLVRLERSFPDDVRILEMKGTLLARLGRAQEARQAWERVLVLDPENAAVLRALEDLEERAP